MLVSLDTQWILGESVDRKVTNDGNPYRIARLLSLVSFFVSFAISFHTNTQRSARHEPLMFSCSVGPAFPGLAPGARAEVDFMRFSRKNGPEGPVQAQEGPKVSSATSHARKPRGR